MRIKYSTPFSKTHRSLSLALTVSINSSTVALANGHAGAVVPIVATPTPVLHSGGSGAHMPHQHLNAAHFAVQNNAATGQNLVIPHYSINNTPAALATPAPVAPTGVAHHLIHHQMSTMFAPTMATGAATPSTTALAPIPTHTQLGVAGAMPTVTPHVHGYHALAIPTMPTHTHSVSLASNIATPVTATAVHHIQPTLASHLGLPADNYQLDLSSKAANIVLGAGMFKTANSVTINEGNGTQTFTAGSKVTAGQYLAIKETLARGTQTLLLDKRGTADGGTFSLNAALRSGAKEIVIPQP